MNLKKNLEIEYLRAVAIFMTLIGHLQLLHFPNSAPYPWYYKFFLYYQPWTGVDLFFCISGYIISKSYMDFFDQYRETHFWEGFQVFWLKRAYRLIPVAWVWLLVNLVCACWFNLTNAFGTLHDNICGITSVLTFWANLANAKGILGPHVVYWSLALEEQFYLLFPLFLLLTAKHSRWKLLIVGVIVQFFISRSPQNLAWFFRFDALLWGILIYLFSQTKNYKLFMPSFLKNSMRKIVVVLLLVYLLGATAAQIAVLPIAVGLVALISASLVWLASYQAGYIPFIPLVSPIMEWFGSRSYSIYLIHMPAYRMSIELSMRYANFHNEELDAAYTIPMVVLALALTYILAELSYRFIEEPFRRQGARLAKEKLLKMQRIQDNTPLTVKLSNTASLIEDGSVA